MGDIKLLQTDAQLKMRLSAMMFLQYFVQGCYLPIVSVYLEDALGFNKREVGYFGSALAIGPLFAPFIIGQLVDRRFSTQHVLAVCHVLGGAVMLLLYFQQGFWTVVVLGTIYSILYVPTMMLTNSLAFHHLADATREFPVVRVWGTIGFIVPAWLIERVILRGVEGEALRTGRGIVLAVAGVSGILMACYCLTLPKTPPKEQSDRRFAPGEVVKLLWIRRFAVLAAISLLVAVVHKFYFVLNAPYLKAILRSGGVTTPWEGSISSIGQVAEIGVMAGLGLLIARIGYKSTLVIGAGAYLIRCLIFAAAFAWDVPFAARLTVVCLGQALHGVCFGCFMAAAFIYLDKTTLSDLRGSVQNIYGTFVLSAGYVVGGVVSGWIGEAFRVGESDVFRWTEIWLSAAGIAAVCVVALMVLFPRDEETEEEETEEGDAKA